MPPIQPRTFLVPDLGHIVRATRPALERNPGWAAKSHDMSSSRSCPNRVVMNW